ncbi:MAG: FAD-dependent oxidoreductase [Burkholderiaceae bacterium]|nr:FAD-dependent oxidoreductase [Burkholderiaceae bacterium]
MQPATVVRAQQMPAGTDSHVPVAIVGAGACGLTAALMLHDAGMGCVLLERDATPGGSTALSSGYIPAPCTRLQQSLGIDDSPARFADDLTAKAHGSAAPHLVQAYAEAIGPALDALEARHGLQWVVLDDFLYPGHSRHRMHAVPEKTGVALMGRMHNAAAAAGIPLLTEALVRQLWVDSSGRVIGLGFERRDGQLEHLACDALLLACNGFGGNAAMVGDLIPDMAGALFAGHAGNDGSAIHWGRALGAAMGDLSGYQGHGSWAVPQGVLMSWAVMMEGGVQINALGERFHNEHLGYSEAAMQVLAQPGGLAWNVFDEPLLAFARGFADFRDAEAAGAVKSAPDAAALARLIGCDAATLNHTLAQIQAGATAADGRRFQRALQAPYFAVKVTGALFHTQGGLDIDSHCRVLREDGPALPNLLAAGGAARGVSGPGADGYLSGNGLLSAIAGGYLAAQTCVLAHTTAKP